MAAHWLDRIWVHLNLGLRFYKDGWGPDLIERLEERHGAFELPAVPPIEWLHETRPLRQGVARRGRFPTPFPADLLPPESRVAHFELLLPRDGGGDPSAVPVCVHLGGVGDQGYFLRRLLAMPLAAAGIGSVILENPFYGDRRPASQKGVALRTVSDQLCLTMAAVEEACALLGWLRARGHRHIGVTGFSMGGYMAAAAGALFPEPIAVVPCVTGINPAPVFTDGMLSHYVDWSCLAGEVGGVPEAKARLREILGRADLGRLQPPRAAAATLLIAARRDGYVPPATVEALHAHWPGSTLRWIDTGHIAAFVAWRAALVAAVRDAFRSLGPVTAAERAWT